jgi:predicted transcriptional regulator
MDETKRKYEGERQTNNMRNCQMFNDGAQYKRGTYMEFAHWLCNEDWKLLRKFREDHVKSSSEAARAQQREQQAGKHTESTAGDRDVL